MTQHEGVRKDPPGEAEEDVVIKRMDSKTLAKHLYNRHKNQFWAHLNLGLSSALMALIGHSAVAPSLPSLVFGLLGSEAGHLLLIWQTFNLRRIHQYHPEVFKGWFGRIAALTNAWSYCVIIQHIWDALGARQSFSRSLIKQGGIQPRAGGSTGRWHYVLSLIPILAFSRRFKKLRYEYNIRYADMEQLDPDLLALWKRTPSRLRNLHMFRGRISQWLSLDVIRCDKPPIYDGPVPILVYYHGGAWLLGDKGYASVAGVSRIASRGVIIAMVNYRMAPECAWPTMVIDCKRALIYVKKHAREWGGHPDRIFVSGESAGGHLSALVGCTPNLSEYQPPEDLSADTSVAGALPLYGVFDITDQNGHLKSIRSTIMDLKVGVKGFFERVVGRVPLNDSTRHLYNLASPTYHIRQAQKALANPRICPYFICHGNLDMLASFGDAKEFYDELQKVRAKFGSWAPNETDVFIEVKSGLHAFGYFPSPRTNAMADAMVDFIFHHTRRLDRLSIESGAENSQLSHIASL